MYGTGMQAENLVAQVTSKPSANLFQRSYKRGQLARLWAFITGATSHLQDATSLVKGKEIGSRRYDGLKAVEIDQIRGSEGRCTDFDSSFHPLNRRSMWRWMSIAAAFLRDTALPAVDLIRIGDTYVVRDGHHRISVARAIGRDYVDAHITVWDIKD